MSVPFYPFHSLPLKLPNRGIDFPFPPLKLSNKRRKEYSKIIIFIHFHSIPSSQTRVKTLNFQPSQNWEECKEKKNRFNEFFY